MTDPKNQVVWGGWGILQDPRALPFPKSLPFSLIGPPSILPWASSFFLWLVTSCDSSKVLQELEAAPLKGLIPAFSNLPKFPLLSHMFLVRLTLIKTQRHHRGPDTAPLQMALQLAGRLMTPGTFPRTELACVSPSLQGSDLLLSNQIRRINRMGCGSTSARRWHWSPFCHQQHPTLVLLL